MGKLVELPPGISQSKQAILGILHSHRLLAKTIWPHHKIQSVTASEDQTMFSLENSVDILAAPIKATITSFDDAISILEEDRASKTSMLVRWTVTEAGKKAQSNEKGPVLKASSQSTTPRSGYLLEESTVFSSSLPQIWFYNMHHSCTAHAELLVGLLAKIAVQEGCMQVIPIATEKQDVGYEKCKAE